MTCDGDMFGAEKLFFPSAIRVITRGDILHIAPNSPHLLKPWRFVAIFMLEYGMWRTLRLWPSSHTWNYSKSSNGSGENEVLRWLTSF